MEVKKHIETFVDIKIGDQRMLLTLDEAIELQKTLLKEVTPTIKPEEVTLESLLDHVEVVSDEVKSESDGVKSESDGVKSESDELKRIRENPTLNTEKDDSWRKRNKEWIKDIRENPILGVDTKEIYPTGVRENLPLWWDKTLDEGE